ncbi:MAG TPA: DUF2723 domain-containing protein [Ignavibacteria bacterium]|nr:DUF2723 domain-containing protein [Ignavibacteria bacterium]
MNFKLTNRIFAAFVFLFATIVYVMTVQPTFSFWDCGEFIACAYTLSVPHPPGAPFFTLMGRIFTMFPSAADIGLRVNYLSVISSSICVLLLYLVSAKVIINWRGIPKSTFDVLLICGSSAVGALSYAFSDSFWFNAMEGEVYGMGTLLIGICIYVLMIWWERSDEPGSDKYLLLVAYVVGLSIGIHLIVAQCIFLAGLFFYFKRYEYSPKTLLIAIALSSVAFLIVYPGLVKKFPLILSGSVAVGVLLIGLIIFGIYYARQKLNPILSLLTLSLFLIILGYSTYISIMQRANVENLPLNENKPSNLESLISYLNREQYGQQPLVMPRRYSQEPQHQGIYQKYSSDMEFMWKYQINHMFNRYWFWNYIGRAGYDQNDGVDFKKLFAIPFLLGMFGLFYQFRKDWKLGFIFLMMFIMMGIVTALYQNQQEPQPRERDYFYVGAFMAFSLWIGIGVAGLIEIISEKMKNKGSLVAVCSVVLILSFAAVPIRMLQVGYHYQNRNGNFLPYDYAYNLLQSVEKDAILITNGDNDTFPLWCLQAAYGVRTDVRIVNLSLAQTDWYNLQLKNERPYGALTVPINLTNEQLKRLQPVQWDEKKPVSFDVPVTAYPDSMRSQPGLPNKIVVNIAPTIRQQSGSQVITALKANDLLLIDIVKANKWERPIYFSITVSEENYIGLGEYLVMEGMAQRIVPYKTNSGSAESINVDIMRKSLFDNPSVPSKTPQYGFRFTGLNDKNLFYNEDQTRMSQTYRTVFLRLAYNYAADSTKYKMVEEVLDKMQNDIPGDVIAMDYRLEYDVALLYNKIGNKQKFNELSDDVINRAEEELKTNPSNVQSYYNPYRILLDIYEARGEYNKALDLLNTLNAQNPGDASVKQKMESIKQKMNSGK